MPAGSPSDEHAFHPATVVQSCQSRKQEEDEETLQSHSSSLPIFFYLLSFAPPIDSPLRSPRAFFFHPIILYIIGTIAAIIGGFASFPILDLVYGLYWSNRITEGAAPPAIRHASDFAAIILIVTAALCLIMTWIFQICFVMASNDLTKRLRHSYVASVLSQDASYFDTHGAGEVATHAGKEIHVIRTGFGEKLGFSIWTTTILICSLIIGFSVAARVTGFLFTIVPIVLAVFTLLAMATEKVGAPALRLEGRASSFVEEIFGSMRIVQSFGMSNALLDKYSKDMLGKSARFGKQKAMIRGLEAGIVYFSLFLVYSAAFWFIGLHTADGSLDLGNGLTAFWNLINSLFAFSSAVPHISGIFEAMSALNLVRRAIEREPKIDVRERGGLRLPALQVKSEFEVANVTFAYPSRPNNASLRDVSITLEEGKVTALVGPSGSGKSTITSLLLREYDPETANIPVASDAKIQAEEKKQDAKAEAKEEKKSLKRSHDKTSLEGKVEEGRNSKEVERVQGSGTVSYSGHDVRKLNLRWLRSQIAIVRQDPQIFTASIFENVASGLSGTEWAYRPDIDGMKEASEEVRARTLIIREKVKDALRKAQALDFVEKLPEGMDTDVSGGKTGLLSGGQRQRLSLARALVRQPKVLVIDEGTSAIDSNTEEKIRLMLQDEHKERGMTICLIAHRLSTVEKADKIVVMKNGSVVDQGTHVELMEKRRKNQTYREMVMHQRALVETDADSEQEGRAVDSMSSNSDKESQVDLDQDGATTKVATSTIFPLESDSFASPAPAQQRPLMQHRGSRASDHAGRIVSGRSIAFSQVEHTAEASATQVQLNKATPIMHNKAPMQDLPQSEGVADDTFGPGESKVGKEEENPRHLGKNFVALLSRHKYEFAIGIIGAIIAGAVFPLSGLITGYAVDALDQPTPALIRSGTKLWSLVFLCMAIADLLLIVVQSYFLESASEEMSRHLKKRALSSLMTQEIGFFDRRENASGALAADMTSHSASISAATGLILSQIIISLANLVGSVILAFVLNWKAAFVCLSPVVVLFFSGWINVAFLERYETSLQGPSSTASSFISENVSGIKEIVALGRERETLRIFDEQSKSNTPKQNKFLLYGAGGFSISQAAVFATAALIFYYGGKLRSEDTLSVTALYAIFEAGIISVFSAGRIFTFTGDFGRAAAAFKTLCVWFERKAKIEVLEPRSAGNDAIGKEAGEWFQQDIVFKDVELRYPQRPTHPAITNLNLTIHAGQSHAFCGTSGSGKSTILQMVQRFYDPYSGTITVGNEDIRAIDLDVLRSEMSYVSQDACLYQGTIRFNLLLGAAKGQHVSNEEVEACCEEACIADFIRGLPEGFETEIGQKGSQLSGGQKQRICIARALIKKPRILLLDEATSALDAQSEVSVQKALDNASVGRTTLTVAHRLSTIRNCNIIHVVEDGKIVESGSHSDLISRRGRYLDLIEAQI
ncbi:hypothetical protein CBS101457_002401 [Exobasidium rhododendri]|nr:hypothetical protein CBS101457_002401 [Exobasidium rhododendri]